VSAPKPPLSLVEQAELRAFQEPRETGVRLITKDEKKKQKRRLGKSKPEKPPIIKTEPSKAHPEVTEIRQVRRHGRSRTISVEFATQRKL
jgi:Bacterial translation initiation factor IF-2 associated region